MALGFQKLYAIPNMHVLSPDDGPGYELAAAVPAACHQAYSVTIESKPSEILSSIKLFHFLSFPGHIAPHALTPLCSFQD